MTQPKKPIFNEVAFITLAKFLNKIPSLKWFKVSVHVMTIDSFNTQYISTI